MKSDLIRWIRTGAPVRSRVIVIAVAVHALGEDFATKDILRAADAVGKSLVIEWWRGMTFEDRRMHTAASDVLRPRHIPIEASPLLESLGVVPVLRSGSAVGRQGLFSSGAARDLVEQEFLKAGVLIHRACRGGNANVRPLGCTLLKTAGFGTMFVSFRNVANTTPLVFWADHPWYPLFPRKRVPGRTVRG